MKNLIVSLAMLMTVAAHAESQVIYLPKGGQMALTAGVMMGPNASFKADSGTEVTLSGSVIGLDFMWGVDDQMSVGVATSSGSTKMELKNFGTTTSSGMSDLMLKGRMNMGMWVYGADLGLSLANHIKDGNTTNRATGGISIIPMGGIIMSSESLNYGALVSYNLLLDRTEETKGVADKTTYSGGNSLTLAPFIEWNYGSGFLTGQFAIHTASDMTSKTGGVTGTSKGDNYNSLKVGGSYHFTESITGLADFTMDMHAANSDQQNPAYTANTIGLGARFVF